MVSSFLLVLLILYIQPIQGNSTCSYRESSLWLLGELNELTDVKLLTQCLPQPKYSIRGQLELSGAVQHGLGAVYALHGCLTAFHGFSAVGD